ncbi:3'-5' exonuclease [Paraclostridium sordellii]|uniref:Exonuclease n=1 Tax=Paraclostridium sordellii TaxID=1505 RepID=A0A0C7GAV0_PARSO|nr:3'-5' exonuclease [Paeniclostridium sordellii]QYE98624.1 exonuclease domain-containing protein [Paeniclostridium sordellii]CEN79514.1 exonuclease [[Clostridium] sordellii] [Paeniclostridium sordellii]CEO05738.1 exonuclease [[Clostridium] sordellii] [Paeniclostridium sordellii]CEP86194.1 exonuclease [[Clostridium] sordellii] [Paeniclostridium sordellii]CEP96446.1 exonuclease [[Clostridium] sordellii] [Paeniclostridium sordellii]
MKKIYVDFEMNMSNSKYGRDINNADIIAIGAVKYDTISKKISSFKSLIKPVSNIDVYPHIEELTKITNEDLENAPNYEEVMRNFKKWLGNFTDIQGIYTFGNLDLTCFANTDRRSAKKNNHPRFVNNIKDLFIDIKKHYLNQGIRCINYVSLKNLLEWANVKFDGNAHDPLADAYNLLILDNTLSSQKEIRELLIIKDIIKKPFIELNNGLEHSFEEYKEMVHSKNKNLCLDYISIEIIKTFKLYLESIIDIDIHNIEELKDIEKKLLIFNNVIDIKDGYFYLLESVYFDMMDLLEDLSFYKLNREEYKRELIKILELFEEDLEYENIHLFERLEASY